MSAICDDSGAHVQTAKTLLVNTLQRAVMALLQIVILSVCAYCL